MSNVAFTLLNQSNSTSRFAPRLGHLLVTRQDQSNVELHTPGFLASTSRGAIPHMSRDTVLETRAVRGVHIPYASFLEQSPPLPPLYPSSYPLHDFTGFSWQKHLVSLALRDPSDLRLTPPNGNDRVTVWTGRGVRTAVAGAFHSQAIACKPDLLEAMSDAPYSAPPYSQRRLTRSIERTTGWLTELLKLNAGSRNVLVQMLGGASLAARRAFADALLQDGTDELPGRATIHDSVSGFVFDLAYLRQAVAADLRATDTTQEKGAVVPHLQASLEALDVGKLRVAHTATSPHDVLLLVRDVGIDVFDSKWAQDAAHHGVALDFAFPVPSEWDTSARAPRRRDDGLIDLGHNLFNDQYAHDHSPFSTALPDCSCAACSPSTPLEHLRHSSLTDAVTRDVAPKPRPYMRSYIHHLLRTHEMTAQALLAAHNLSVLDAFFAGIRRVLSDGGEDAYKIAADDFIARYDGAMRIVDEARVDWKDVDLARGKGRLAREKVLAAEAEG